MRCPQCNGSRSRVLNTRPRRLDTITYRSRQCLDCGTQWPTYEISMQPEILRRRAVLRTPENESFPKPLTATPA